MDNRSPPGWEKKDTASCAPVADRKWEAGDARRPLTRAHEIIRDKKLMAEGAFGARFVPAPGLEEWLAATFIAEGSRPAAGERRGQHLPSVRHVRAGTAVAGLEFRLRIGCVLTASVGCPVMERFNAYHTVPGRPRIR